MSRRSKTSKGILGHRKSIHGQLMPFGPYAEAYPSDDSEDSDYNPSDDGVQSGQVKVGPGEISETEMKNRTQRDAKG